MTKKEKIEKVNTTEQTTEQTAEQTTEQTAEQTTEQTAEQTTELVIDKPSGNPEPVKHFDILASEKLTNLTNSISLLKEVQKRSDYGIAYALNLINKHHKDEIKELGYKNVEEYAFSKFDYSKSTFHNYVKIAERFINPKLELRKSISSDTFEITSIMANNSFSVLEDVDGYPFTISQMLEMLPLTDEQIQEHIEEFSAGDTTKTIRNKVNAIRSAISTTATESGAESGAGTTSSPSDDTSRILAILEIVNKLENDDIRNKLVEAINSVINS